MKSIEDYPVLKVVLDYVIKRLELVVILALTGTGLSIYQHHSNHNQIWNETGNHFQDLVVIEQQQQKQIGYLQAELMKVKYARTNN
jgi:hypothetical protein